MREIVMTNGFVATVDDQDFEQISSSRWSGYKNWHTSYARRWAVKEDGRLTRMMMHREIMERVLGRPLKSTEPIDHKNGNGLDNRRENLRLATVSQNATNRKKRSFCFSSIFLGVSKRRKDRKWKAQITIEGKRTYLGMFPSEIEAAKARDAFVLSHGIVAQLNFPELATDQPAEPADADGLACGHEYQDGSHCNRRKSECAEHGTVKP